MSVVEADTHVLVVRGQGIEALQRLDRGRPILLPVAQRRLVQVYQVQLIPGIAVVRLEGQDRLKMLAGFVEPVSSNGVQAQLVVSRGQHSLDVLALVVTVEAAELVECRYGLCQLAALIGGHCLPV